MNQILTDAFKAVILDYGLIDTGDLYSSVNVSTTLNDNQLIINIECNDYVKYHLELGLIDSFIAKFEVSEEIGTFYEPLINQAIQDVLDGKEVEEPLYDVVISINGE